MFPHFMMITLVRCSQVTPDGLRELKKSVSENGWAFSSTLHCFLEGELQGRSFEELQNIIYKGEEELKKHRLEIFVGCVLSLYHLIYCF